MQNTINIIIGGRLISIYDNAWQMKLAYIETLYDYFIHEEGRFEIINDIKSRIAELMQEVINRQNTPINETNMERIIQIMGTADQFKKLDTDVWEIANTSPEHSNAIDRLGIIKSSFNLNKNALYCSE